MSLEIMGDRESGFNGFYEDENEFSLRPCPFCGTSYDLELCNTHSASYWVECHHCRAQGPSGDYEQRFQSKEACERAHQRAQQCAVNKWNSRGRKN